MDYESEAVFIEHDRDSSLFEEHIIVGGIYRPSGAEVNQFNHTTSDVLELDNKWKCIIYLEIII